MLLASKVAQCPSEVVGMSSKEGTKLVGSKGFESTNYMETEEFCDAARPSKSLKGKQWNRQMPPTCPKKGGLEFGRRCPSRNSIRARLAMPQF
jgi:hypothetical protein